MPWAVARMAVPGSKPEPSRASAPRSATAPSHPTCSERRNPYPLTAATRCTLLKSACVARPVLLAFRVPAKGNPPLAFCTLTSHCRPLAAGRGRLAALRACTANEVESTVLTHGVWLKRSGKPPSAHSVLARNDAAAAG